MKRALLFLILLVLLVVLVRMGQVALRRARTPAITAECAQIKPGDTRASVIATLNRSVPPDFIRDQGNKITSIRADGSCVVEFNSDGIVQKAFVDASNKTWNYESKAGGPDKSN
jgi:hypothetical protein